MKHRGKVLVFAVYFLFVIGFCLAQYFLYRDSFEYAATYEHPMQLETSDTPIYLDLNSAKAAELARIPGVSRPLADEIVRYRKEIGGFTGFQQLLKIDGMPEQLYLSLGDYLYLTPVQTEPETTAKPETTAEPETTKTETTQMTETEPAAVLFLNLNTATAEELCLLPEIGEVTAAAIIAYRDAIGGFSNRQQLLEVSGIGDVTLAKISPYLYLPDEQEITEPAAETEPVTDPPETTEEISTIPPEIPIINLNTATAEDLMKLPDCDAVLAANILRLRDDIHVFQNILEILYAEDMTTELYLLWEQYLAVDDEGNQQATRSASE